ncbi:MAG: DUF4012 domain-containing protein [Caldilineaceae bacterium]|nr:DUF4012 domain-containing protein [Caldilineaceae bacterium]
MTAHFESSIEIGNPPAPKAKRNLLWWRRHAVGLFSLLLLLGILWLGYKAVRIGFYTWSAYSTGMSILSTLRADSGLETVATLQPEVSSLAASVAGIEGQMRAFSPLLNALDGWTVYGSTLAAVPELLTAGGELSALAAEGLALTAPALKSADGEPIVALASLAQQRSAEFSRLTERAERANLALLSISTAGIHPVLAERLTQVQSLSPLMGPTLQTAPAFPDLLGMRSPVTYLILFQNNHELRGTGGFISAVGELTLSRGRISNLDTTDGYNIFSKDIEYGPAPEAMQKYLKTEILVFRDANWSPDLPTSARTARHLYEQVRDAKINGVVTVDLNAVELIIDAMGGISVDGVEGQVTGANVVDIIKQLWDNPLDTEATVQDNWQEWYAQRKDFVPVLAAAILERMTSRQFSFFSLISAGTRALDERSVQIWMDNPQANAQFGQLGWNGALHTEVGADYLGLVDTNVGFNKVNAVVTREVDYKLTWPNGPSRAAQAVVTVTYTHPITQADPGCDSTPRYGNSYDNMIARCYFNYVRLYVPRNSRLISIEGVEEDSISRRIGEERTQVLAGYFVMETNSEHTVTFTYELPVALKEDGYRLIVQRQSGSGPLPITWTIGDGDPQSATIEGNWIEVSEEE